MSKFSNLKCGRRLPSVERNGWRFSLLCDLPIAHEGPCEPDDLEILAGTVIPGLKQHQWWCGGKEPCACTETWKAKYLKRPDPDGTIELMLEQARVNDKRTMEAIYGRQD